MYPTRMSRIYYTVISLLREKKREFSRKPKLVSQNDDIFILIIFNTHVPKMYFKSPHLFKWSRENIIELLPEDTGI